MNRFIGIIVSLLFATYNMFAEDLNQLFLHYTTEEGLSSNNVHDITEDAHGFIWLSTHYGISRFDGKEFKTYYAEQNPNMIRNDIYHAFVLPNGEVSFAGSNFVLFSYDENYSSFKQIPFSSNQQELQYDITGFSIQSDGEGILSSGDGVFLYDKEQALFTRTLEQLKGNTVLVIRKDSFNHYWIGDYKGVYIVNQKGEILPHYDFRNSMDEMINNLLLIDHHHILLCSTVGALWLATINDDGTISAPQKINTPFRSVSAIVQDKDKHIWIGTSGSGLWKTDFEKERFKFQKVIPINEDENAILKITSLFVDSRNNIWVSTQNSDVWRTQNIIQYNYFSSLSVGIPKTMGCCFADMSNGDLLYGTDGTGLYVLDNNFQVKKHYTNTTGLSSNNVLSIEKDDDNFLIGFWGGTTQRYITHLHKFDAIQYGNLSKPINRTKNIKRTSADDLYISTAGDGIYCQSDGRWQRIQLSDTSMIDSPDLWMEQTLQLSDNTLRILSSRTIWSNHSGSFKSIFPDIAKSNSQNPLLFLQGTKDHEGNYFVASNQGIYRFDVNDSSYEKLSFLPSGEYASIVMDSNGILWTSGSNGILSVDYKNKKYETKFIGKKMSGDYFVRKAAFLSASGKLFFGSKDGFICINPQVGDNNHTDYLSFAELFIKGEKINVNDDLLPLPLNQTKLLTLKHNQTHCTLTFDIVNNTLTDNAIVAYRIPTIDTTWTDLGNQRAITINHLPDGDFEIELGTFTPDFQKQKQISLAIRVLAPWWKTKTFIFLTSLLFILIVMLIAYLRIRSINKRKQELQKLVDEQTIDLIKANQTLEKQKSAIQERNNMLISTLKQKDQLVSVVAHDLKNPMFAIVSTLKRLVTNIYEPTESQRILTNVSKEAEKIEKEMIHLLQWAASSEEQLQCEKQNVDIQKLISEVVSLLLGIAQNKDILLATDVQTAHHALADYKMLATIVRNLTTNAIKFTPKGKTIRLTATESEEAILLEITDEGVGMTEDKIKEILQGEKNISQKGTEQEAGFGLGFHIIHDFIQKMGVKMEIESQLNVGTKIRLILPIGSEIISMDTTETKGQPIQNVSLSIDKKILDGKTILIVDDDELLLENIAEMLSPYSSVITATDGAKGFDKALENIPDLIISDVDMPFMNGIEMCKQIASNNVTSNIPLLFLSAKSDTSVRLTGLAEGAIDFIPKPFNSDELLIKTVNFLRREQRHQIQILAGPLSNEEANNRMNPLIERLLDLIKKNYTNANYSFNDIANDLGMSKSTLTRRLKSIIDKSPVELLSEYRLNMGKSLLAKGNLSISDVAYSVGFNDPSYFSRKYKDFFGKNPFSDKSDNNE